MAEKAKIFVFDLDGTLADTAPALINGEAFAFDWRHSGMRIGFIF